MIEEFDNRSGYCPKLGHHINFKYCRLVNNDLPCYKIINCWFEQLPAADFVNKNYSHEQIDQFLTPPKSKIASLLEIIQNVTKKNQ
jgi:hypothetical protein